MKNYIAITCLICLVFLSEPSFTQVPTYELTAKNFNYVAVNDLEFDMYMRHTNSPVTFEYSGGQYFFNFNPLVANGGTLSYAIISSDLPLNIQPRNPQVTGSQLRLAANSFPGAGFGYVMTNNGSPGTLIVRMKLKTTAPSFASVPLSLSWRSSLPDPFTKVYAYVSGINTNISNPNSQFIDSSGILIRVNVTVALEGLYRTVISRHIKRDTVTVFVRRATAPFALVDSARSVLDSVSLSASVTFRNISSGQYYLVVKHKNSMETWSRPGGESYVVGNTYNYDFTASQAQAYGGNTIQKGTRWCLYSGNVNQDFIIDASDMLLVDNDLFAFVSGNVVTDVNGDGIVDIDDLAILDNNVTRIVILQRP